MRSRESWSTPLMWILGFVAALAAAAPGALAADYHYYAGGEATRIRLSRFHAAVRTPAEADTAKLEATLSGALGAGVRFIPVPKEGLTLVGVPEASYPVALADVLESAGFATRFAFSGKWPDGSEAWPTVVMPELRVRFRSAAIAEETLPALKAAGVEVVWGRGEGRDFFLRAASSEEALTLAARLYESGRVVFSYPDLLLRHVRHLEPSDTYFDDQWHLPMIGAAPTWDTWRGSSSVVIAIIDSGVDMAHTDLAGNLVGGYDIVGDGYSTDTDPQPSGDDAHGTACAGLAAAVSDNDRGVAGVCHDCKVMPIRIMGGGYYRAADEEDAFNWARTHGADVLSNSWGPAPPIDYNYFADGLRSEIHQAVQQNKIVLFASGNENDPLTCPGGIPWEPAAYSEVISVGASDWYDRRMSYSNYGSSGCPLTLIAPAASVTADISGSRGYSNTDYTQDFGGTSAATPVTAGAVGLLLSIDQTLTWGQVVDALKRSADKIGGVSYDADGYNRYYGWGRLNLYRAAGYVSSGDLCQPEAGGELFGIAACNDGRDNDCDGMIDSADPSCAPDDVAIGSDCSQGCGSEGKFCIEEFPDGYCTGMCGTGNTCETGAVCWTCWCDTGAGTQPDCSCDPDGCDCNTTAECDPGTGGYACECDPNCNYCLDRCLADNECRSGYVCEYITETSRVCYPGCAAGLWSCEAGETCNAATGRCEHDGPTAVGGACTDYLQCADNGWCLASSDWPNGYCSLECDAGGACPATSSCVHFTDVNFCFQTCSRKSDCRIGYGCWKDFLATGRICWQVCTAADCRGGEVCCATTGGCEVEADCPEDPTCTCNATPSCDADCACDRDCGCSCDLSAACETGCSCDLDCCTCDVSAGCDAGCPCDPDCGSTCACDLTAACDAGCPCDASCGMCACDVDTTCPDNYQVLCPCDAECPCVCDEYEGCDEGCRCDPECYGEGCSCHGAAASQAGGLAVALWALVAAARRRRRAV